MPFTSKLLQKDTWAIFNHGATAYLVAGEREGGMIDTGDAPEDLRAYAESLCGKPVRIALNTHGHFDHTGGNGYFRVAFMGPLAAKIAKTPNGGQDIEKYPLDYEIVPVTDGFTLDLGDRVIEAIRMDGHSPDCIAWLDHGGRLMFTGDNLMPGVPLKYKCVDPQPSMLLYAMSMAKLMARRDEFDHCCGGHTEELLPGDMVNHALAAAIRALDGETDGEPPRLPKERSPRDAGDKGPDFSKHDPAAQGFVKYKDVGLMFDKRYLRDATRYEVVEGT